MNGNVYEGEFFAGKAEGEGVLKTAKGDVYAGQWQQGREWGEGVCQWADHRKFTGDWQGGKKHGQGCMMWPDGTGTRCIAVFIAFFGLAHAIIRI